ncbi:MAG TPA: hypothetical protein VNE21_03090 [Mycobacteriales bacterium]|nr:hypothetical protein [Mycobacteriales bacterium]
MPPGLPVPPGLPSGLPAGLPAARAEPSRGVPELIAGVAAAENLERRALGGLIVRLGVALAGSARRAGGGAVTSGRWVTDTVVEAAPHLPVRDRATLSAHHGGLTGADLAEALVATASRVTAAIGAAGGALAAAEFAAPAALLSAPVQLAAETLAVVAVEVKLVAELHEVFDRVPQGTARQRALAYLGSWTRRRALDPQSAGGPLLGDVLGATARRQLRGRLLRRLGRNVSTLAPLFAGAVAGAALNARATRALGDRLVADLSPDP